MDDHGVVDLLAQMRNTTAEAREALEAVEEDLSVQGRPEEVGQAGALRDLAIRLVEQYEELYRLLDDTT